MFMSKERLFEKIRHESVVLWAGAGLSIYAGYPTGVQLAQILYNNLPAEDQSSTLPTAPLTNIATELVRSNGNKRNNLNKILCDIFINRRPSSIEYHEKLASIPHIRTIITTNYDKLFENAYRGKLQLATKDEDIAYLNSNIPTLYKIHGDLEHNKDGIVITGQDYYDFVKRENDLINTVIKERLASNSVLFLGYNLEDPNMMATFETITSKLGNHMHEAFLVAPNLQLSKVADLNQKGIQYINSKAQPFINELLDNIKDNIQDDFFKEKVSIDTYKTFMNNHNIEVDFGTDNGKYFIRGFRGINNTMLKGELLLNLDQNQESQFLEHITGRNLRPLELNAKTIGDIKYKIEGITLSTDSTNSKIILSPPSISQYVTVMLPNGYEIRNVKVSWILTKFKSLLSFELESGVIEFEGPGEDTVPDDNGKVNYTVYNKHNEKYETTGFEMDYFQFIANFSNGKKFTIYTLQHDELEFAFSSNKNLYAAAQAKLNYFEKLRQIETHYGFRFNNIDSINDEILEKVATVLCAIDGVTELPWENPLTFKVSEVNTDDLINQTLNDSFFMQSSLPVEIELYGRTINLGYQVIEFCDPYLANAEEIRINKTKTINYLGKNNKIKMSFHQSQQKFDNHIKLQL